MRRSAVVRSGDFHVFLDVATNVTLVVAYRLNLAVKSGAISGVPSSNVHDLHIQPLNPCHSLNVTLSSNVESTASFVTQSHKGWLLEATVIVPYFVDDKFLKF